MARKTLHPAKKMQAVMVEACIFGSTKTKRNEK